GKSDIKVHFTSFNVANGDELYIHDGASASSPQIPGSPFSGTSLPPDYFSTNPDYALTFYFKSNVQINDDGWRAEISSQIVSDTERKYSDHITNFELHPNYPNPFNPTTTIKYDIPKEAHVLLKIYNIRGQEVRTLVDSKVSTGSHRVVWNGTNNHGEPVTSGIYIYKMKAGNYSTVKKMIFIK
ncbi:MAG: T9SS type A sorting domain-containing protein, partial [Calditrichales bacterium]|nr:T9SS type A sorting domain-containing protein [Calditrichales bacterium]